MGKITRKQLDALDYKMRSALFNAGKEAYDLCRLALLRITPRQRSNVKFEIGAFLLAHVSVLLSSIDTYESLYDLILFQARSYVGNQLGASGDTLTRLLGDRVEKYESLLLKNVSGEKSHPLVAYEYLCKHLLAITKSDFGLNIEKQNLDLIDPKDAERLAERIGPHIENDVIFPMIAIYKSVIEIINGVQESEV